MAKDPAFLFYPNDFTSGTRFFNNEQVGKYVRLLCAQFDTGHLLEEDMIKICLSYDKHIFSKFEKDSEGLYFNRRLDNEMIRRKKYSQSRRKNRTSKNNICSTYDKHMETETETINSTSSSTSSSAEFFEKLSHDMKIQQIWLEAICMKHKFKMDQVLKLIDDFILHLKTQGGERKSLKEAMSHFDYWLNKIPSDKKPFKSNSKLIS